MWFRMYLLFLSTSLRSSHSFAFVGLAVASGERTASSSGCVAAKNSVRYSRCVSRYHLSSSSSSDNINGENINNSNNINKKPRPKTGWNHNLPSESSDFWQGPGPEVPKPDSSKQQQQRQPLRTGWLHNTQPAQQERAKQQSSTGTSSTVSSSSTSSSSSVARIRLEQAMKEQQTNHRIINPPTFHASPLGKRGIVTTEHRLSVPLHRDDAGNAKSTNGARIDVYFTIVEPVSTDEYGTFLQSLVHMENPQQRARSYVQNAALKNADAMILYLQGGPGFGAPNPITGLGFSSGGASWAAKALESTPYKRVVLMDQRGTGKSSPVTKQSLELQFPDLFLLDTNKDGKILAEYESSFPDQSKAVNQAVKHVTDYLSQFRADNIVWDAEDIRQALLAPPNLDTPEGMQQAEQQQQQQKIEPKPWGCSLGQSYGGFCSMTYLSLVEHPPRVMLLTGGIAPMLTNDLTTVYSAFCERVRQRNLLYYDMYAADIKAVHKIVQKLLSTDVKLPSGGTLTARRFLQAGLMLGSSPSSFTALHNIVNNAFLQLPNQLSINDIPLEELQFRRSFLKEMDSVSSFDDAPFYYWMHESIYADGPGKSNPTNWAAHRAFEQKAIENTDFDYRVTSSSSSSDHAGEQQLRPTLFFGEMVFPWMSEDYAELSGVGLTAVAHALAEKSDWPTLYDADRMRSALASGRTKAAAAQYYDDMYVDFNESMKVTALGGPLEKCKVYVTNEYQHSGLRDDGASIFAKLYGMALGSIRTPS